MVNEKDMVEKIWADALVILKEKLPAGTFDAWIPTLLPNSFDDNEFIIGCGQRIALHSLAQYTNVFSQVLSKITEKEIFCKLVFDEEIAKKLTKMAKEKKKEESEVITKSPQKALVADNLNIKFTFNNFVKSSNSELAYAGAQAVANNPGKTTYNPLFIYGVSGVGKTHLLQAIGHETLKKGIKSRYFKCEEFINDFIQAVAKGLNKGNNSDRNSKMISLRQKYRNCDVLLIDDIQFIENKQQTQVEIFNTFESLYNSGKQIVFTSDRPPSAISNLADRLKTRFEGGLLVDIQPPDIETRMAIIQRLCEEENVFLSNEIITFLAEVYSANVRELKGAFNKVLAYYNLLQTELSLDSVKKLLHYKENIKTYTSETIISTVASYFQVSEDDILGTGRAQRIANARQIAIYLIKELTGDNWSTIGTTFDKKHSTIIYSYEKMLKDMQIDTRLKNSVAEIQERLG